jgi:hypothetical protein
VQKKEHIFELFFLLSFKTESIRVEEKRKHLGESERRFISEGEKRESC